MGGAPSCAFIRTAGLHLPQLLVGLGAGHRCAGLHLSALLGCIWPAALCCRPAFIRPAGLHLPQLLVGLGAGHRCAGLHLSALLGCIWPAALCCRPAFTRPAGCIYPSRWPAVEHPFFGCGGLPHILLPILRFQKFLFFMIPIYVHKCILYIYYI
jgi:hypothetical protein